MKSAGTLVVIGSLIIVFFYPYPPDFQLSQTSYFYYNDINVCRVGISNIPYEFVAGKLIRIGFCRVEVDNIPEYGIIVTIVAQIKKWGEGFWRIRKEWTITFYPEENDTLPIERLIHLSISFAEDDFTNCVGAFYIGSSGSVIKEGSKIEPLNGGGSSEHQIQIVVENPTIAFFLQNLFGIGLGLFSLGIVMIIVILVEKKTGFARTSPLKANYHYFNR